MIFSWRKKRKKSWPTFAFAEILKRARILVVDDSEFHYLDLLKRDGYTVEKWDDVDDLPKLESGHYDLILLDIQGVGLQLSHDQGHGVLRHLKETNPTQIVIAYSNADWSLKYQEFWSEADAALDKRADYVDFKKVIDRLLRRRFSFEFYLDRIDSLATEAGMDGSRARGVAREAILGRNPDPLREHLRAQSIDVGRVTLIIQIAQAAIDILQLALVE